MNMGAEFWTQDVAATKLQAASTRDYAGQHGIFVAALNYWQRKLMASADRRAQSAAAGKFVALRVASAVEALLACRCTLVLAPVMRLETAELPVVR